jgi:flagellin
MHIGHGQPLSGLSSLSRGTRALETFSKQAGSGSRITTAASDPAGAAVVVDLASVRASERVALRNASDGQSLLEVADGAARGATDALERMRELAVQSASETLADDAREGLQAEFEQLRDEVVRIADSTTFGGRPLTNGSTSAVSVQVGIHGDATSRIDVPLTDLSAGALGLTGASVASSADAGAALDAIDGALDRTTRQRADLGSSFRSLSSAADQGRNQEVAAAGAASRIQDADIAELTSKQASAQIRQHAGVSSMVQARNIHRDAILGMLS